MRMSMRCLVFAMALLISGLLPAAEPTIWTPAGWGGGGFYYAAAFHPTRDGVLYLAGDVSGVYKSIDHGRTWSMINNGLVNYGVFTLATDRTNPETIYAATDGGLCKSTDGGTHWRLLPKTGPKELHITGERGKSIHCIAVNPADGNIVYAGSPTGKIYRSADGGQSWSVSFEQKMEAAGGAVCSVAIAPSEPALVLAATSDSGLLISTDAGAHWRAADAPKNASGAAIAASDPNIIYASFQTDGVWKSIDKGQSWKQISHGLPKGMSFSDVAVSPANPRDVYAIGTVGWNGAFYRSTDGGETWKPSSTLAVDTEVDPTLPEDPRPASLSTPTNIVINPLKPRELYISANWRSCMSEDGGVTWAERNREADISCVYDIRFSGARTYACAMDEGTLVTENNGKDWKQLWPLKNTPEISGHDWRLNVTPINGVDRVISTCSPWDTQHPNCVVISSDGGKTFHASAKGLPDYVPRLDTVWGQGYARALAADPKNPQILYLGIDGSPENGKSGGGIFKSEDGGENWAQLPHQPGNRKMFFGVAVDPTNSNRLYWSSCGDGLYRSEDGGANWQTVFKNETWVFNVVLTADGTVYCPSQNLWRSSDHGATWKQITKLSGRMIVAVEVHPRDPKTIWFATTTWDGSDQGAVYKTTDGGETWQEITGNLPYHKPLVLRFNPQTNELWAGGVGIYRTKQ
jgi:photosystem II stability/assembly factor-like uncharacterized protein